MTHARIAPGCRRLTPAHVQVQAIAEDFQGLPEGVSKGQALAAFKQAARPLGLSPRLRDAIDVLFAFSAPQDWQPGARPIVWPSNRKLEATLGLARRQVQNVLNALIRANLMTPVDPPAGAGDTATPRPARSSRPTASISRRLAFAMRNSSPSPSALPPRSANGRPYDGG